jgi:hypothetical protein
VISAKSILDRKMLKIGKITPLAAAQIMARMNIGSFSLE